MDYLNKNSRPLSHILSTFNEGNFIPAFTLNKIFIGHEVGTNDFINKFGIINAFYAGNMSLEQTKTMLKTNEIDYVLWSSYSLPENYKILLTPIFQKEDLTIYKTKLQ